MSRASRFAPAIWLALVCAAGTACRPKPTPSAAAESAPSAGASAAAPRAPASAAVTVGIPVAPELVAKAVNPTGQQPYTGPTGVVRGSVRIAGDAAPATPDAVKDVPDKCASARRMYGRLFREGSEHRVADVLVAVTRYKGYVPAKSDFVRIDARDCSWDRRTVAVMFGQRLEVVSKDGEPYVPELLGAKEGALLVAIPGGDSIKLYPPLPGQYSLIDDIHPFAKADVFVVAFPTAAVTGLDGEYEIPGVPVGEVSVHALLPAIDQTAEKIVTVTAGTTVVADLTLPFRAGAKSAGSAAPASSTVPPRSGVH